MRPRTVALVGVVALFWVGLIVMRGLASGLAAGTSGQWTPAGALTQPRTGAAAVLLDDGRVLVTGGSFTPAPGADGTPPGPPMPVNTVDISVSTGGLSAAPPMNTARSHHSAVRLRDGRILVAGGIAVASDGTAGAADAATATAEVFDPAAGTWTAVGNMADARSRHTASLLADGRVLIAGGEDGGVTRDTLEVFDPATLSFSAAGVTAVARKDHAAVTLADGRVLLAGGSDDAGVLSSVEIFDPVAATIASAAMSGPRTGLSATRLLDGSVLMAGGNDGMQDLATAEVFDPATSASTLTAAMTSPRRGHQAFLLPNNNSVLLVGGSSSGTALASSELYWPPALAFHASGSMAAARASATGTPLKDDGRLLIAGGANAERYAFATIGTDWDDYAPGETVFMTGQGWEPGETVTLVLHEAQHPDGHEDRLFTVVADETGFIYNDEFAPDLNDLGVRFYVTATGSVSQAQTTFTDGELITAELIGTANDVTVSQGATANFTIRVSASTTDTIKCIATQANPANATVRTVFSISASGLLSSSTPSSPLAFYAAPGTQHGNGQNCDITWTGAPTAYSVAATVSAAATTPIGNYTIALGATAGTTTVSTPAGQGDALADATPTNITVHVIAPPDSTPPVITPTVSGTPGSNGWYVSDVTVSWSVTDPESSISSSTGCTPSTVNTDTTGVTFTCTATSTGGTATKSVTVKRDATPPTAALSITAGTAGAHGWYTSNVTVHTSGSDAISSPVVCTGDQQQTTETSGTPFNGSCTNDAGLTSNAAPLTVKLDKTGPSAQLSVTAGTAGANGWYTSDVTVHTDGTDTISGPVTCTADQNQTAETAGTAFNGSCTNDAGLKTDAAALTIKLDKTGPTAQLSITAGTAGAHGWYTSDVTIHASGTDTISGPVTCTPDQVQTTETAGTPFNGSCTNNAGLSTSAAPLTVKMDKTGPSADLTITSGTPGANGWFTSDVTVHTAGSDAISGPVTCTADQHQTAETAGTPFNGSCTNDAGLATNATPVTIKLDKTAPTAVSSSVTAGTAGAHGWYTSDVTVHTSGTEDISGPVQCTPDQILTTETPGQNVTASCTNQAGLSTNATPLTVKLDKTGPSADLTITGGTPGANGWFTSDVTVHTAGSDAISGPVTCTADQHQIAETAGAPFNGSCTNDAGLTTNAVVLNVKLDKTGPVDVASSVSSGTLGAHGWYVSDVTVHTSGNDDISGPVTCTGDQVLTAETPGQSVEATCTNQAGLSANAAPLVVKIDKTAPSATLTVTGGTPGANGWFTSNVTIHTDGSDTISHPVTCTGDQQQTAESAGAVFHGSCTNDAGLSADAAALTVKLDKTGPTAVSSTVTGGTLGQHGWYVTDVIVHTTGTEDISGPAHCTTDQTIATETPGQNVAGSCTNEAGLTTDAAPVTIKLDKTGPSADLAVTAGTAGANGWFTSDVTLHASGTDAISSPVTCTADQHQVTETAGAAFNASCTNDAGLTTNATPLTIKLDKTPPSATLSASGTAGLNGWFTSSVTVTTTGNDTISGPVVCTGVQTQATDTTGTTFQGSCTNNAGLQGQAAALVVKVDQTPPVISLVAPANGGSYTLNANVPSNYSCTDATSGPASCSGPVASGVKFSTSSIGSNTFLVTAKDQAGNMSTQLATYGVKFATGLCLGELGHSVLQPINVDGSSIFKQKSTVPVKFRVCDANGLSIGSGAVTDFRLVQIVAGTTLNTVNEVVDSTTPDTTFRWDPSGQQWIFNTNTKSLSASMTYVYLITLADATTIQYQFGLK